MNVSTQTPDSDIKKIKREWKRRERVERLMRKNVLMMADSAHSLGVQLREAAFYARDDAMWKRIQAQECCFIFVFPDISNHCYVNQTSSSWSANFISPWQKQKASKEACAVCQREKLRQARNSILWMLIEVFCLPSEIVRIVFGFLKIPNPRYIHW